MDVRRDALLLIAFTASCAAQPRIGGCAVFPPDHIWNARVDHLPVDPHSAAYVASIGEHKPLHPDFGSGLYRGRPMGIPFAVTSRGSPAVKVTFEHPAESDPGPYAIPPDTPIEGGSGSGGDRHAIAVDASNCRLYELFAAYPQPDGTWKAGTGAIFDLTGYRLRPAGWTSADAAGLPILPGLVRYDEIAAGAIRHALRFTVARTQPAYVWPARHRASYWPASWAAGRYPPMGQRFRLRAGVDITRFHPENRVLLLALKLYGMMVADNGGDWYLSGAPDPRWNNERLGELRRLRGADFEAVDVLALRADPDSGQIRPAAR